MTKADQAVETAADKLDTFVKHAQKEGGVKATVAKALADDPAFVRKLKPSLIKERATGKHPAEDASPPPRAPSGPQLARPAKPKKSGGLNPFVVVGAALAVGYLLAKTIDWRGQAHPRV